MIAPGSVVVAVASALCLGACGNVSEQEAAAARGCPPRPTGALALDEHAGTVRGFGIGDGSRAVLRRLHGVRAVWSTENDSPLSHCGAGFVGAMWVPKHVRVLRLRDMVVQFGGKPSRVYAINLVGRGAKTAAGVGIGSSLADVKKAYRSSRPNCTTITGDDGPLWPACFVRVGPRFLYFGGDPVAELDLQPPLEHAPPARPGDRA
jgi:hypothetical protein